MKIKFIENKNFGVFLSEFYSLLDDEISTILRDIDDDTVREQIYKVVSSGKRLRPLLCVLSCQSVGRKMEDAIKLSAAIELAHNATLMHDDVIDSNFNRRGNLNKNFCVVLGDMMISLAVKTSTYYGTEITKMLAYYGLSTSLGEYYDINEKIEDIDEEYYFKKIIKKSASAFMASTHMGALAGKGSENEVNVLKEFGKNIGIAYQLMDDINDLEEDLKNLCITLPLIRLISIVGENEKKDLIENFRKKNIDYLITKINEFKTKEYCKKKFDYYIKNAAKNLEILHESESKEYLKEVVNYIASTGNPAGDSTTIIH